MNVNEAAASTDRSMPVLFVGHGSPMNALADNQWSRGFARLARLVPRPSAIVAISAHWFTEGTYLTESDPPKTIYDFSGFPKTLYEVQYPARGAPDQARKIASALGKQRASLSLDWGLDHGVWTVLRHMYPKADIPVVQLSINRNLNLRQHFELGRSLRDLREQKVLIMASGNVVHNLRDALRRRKDTYPATPLWAQRFDASVKLVTEQRDERSLLTLHETDDGRAAHPTIEHWLPLIYAYAASGSGATAGFPQEGFDLGSLSMRNILFEA